MAVTASDAREELEALLRRSATFPDGSGRRRCVLGEDVISAVLAAADAYRHAPGGVHLEGLAGADSACEYRWQRAELRVLTGSLAAVTCGKCRRSRLYRDMTAEAA